MTVRHRTREPAGNRVAIDAEVRRTMSVVGVGEEYHDKVFADYGDAGVELRDMFVNEVWPRTVREGQGVNLIGSGALAGSLHTMMARAAHVAGANVMVVDLIRLSSMLTRDDGSEVLDEMQSLDVLFIRRFQALGKMPLSAWGESEVASLIDWRLAENKAVFPWMEHKKTTAPDPPWWGQYVRGRLAECNVLHEVIG